MELASKDETPPSNFDIIFAKALYELRNREYQGRGFALIVRNFLHRLNLDFNFPLEMLEASILEFCKQHQFSNPAEQFVKQFGDQKYREALLSSHTREIYPTSEACSHEVKNLYVVVGLIIYTMRFYSNPREVRPSNHSN